MRINRPSNVRTEEGAEAAVISDLEQLRRSVLSCLLWEKEHYEDGVSIADRIVESAKLVDADKVKELAIEARNVHGLRHAPLMLLLDLIRRNENVADAIYETIRRPDEMMELIALYWRNGKRPLTHQMKKGLRRTIKKFNEYSLAKNDRAGSVRLCDVMALVRPKPDTPEQAALFKRIADRKMATPDTWETNLSGGADKKETFERLIKEGNLGYLALLRNLRNMAAANVNRKLVKDAIRARKGADLVFPFRYIAAARAEPIFGDAVQDAFLAATAQMEKLPGKTVVIVDVSGSMYGQPVSAKSDMHRVTAAASLAAIAKELSSDVVVIATGDRHAEVGSHLRGLALVDGIEKNHGCGFGGIYTKAVMEFAKKHHPDAQRVIVITDEQDCGGYGNSPLDAPTYAPVSYMINVASYRNGVGYGKWVHLDGFSEAVMKWIIAYEKTLNGKGAAPKSALAKRRTVG